MGGGPAWPFLFLFNLSASLLFLLCGKQGGGRRGSLLAELSVGVPGRLKIQIISSDSKPQLQTAALAEVLGLFLDFRSLFAGQALENAVGKQILLWSQRRFEKPQGCGCSGGLGLFQGQCHTWNGIMGSFNQAGAVWALGGSGCCWNPQGALGIAAGMVPRSCSQPGRALCPTRP